MKKFISLILGIVICLAAGISAYGCKKDDKDSSDSTSDSESVPTLEDVTVRNDLKATTVRILLPAVDTVYDYVNVTAAINRELMKAGKPYTVDIEYVSDTNYSIQLEDRAKEGYDAAWTHVDNIQDLIAKEVIKTNLMPYMEKWGQAIIDDVPEYAFSQFTDYRTGGLYAIPRHMPTADDRSRLLVRKDWMTEAGIDEIKDIATLDRYLSAVKTKHGSAQGFFTLFPDSGNVHLLREIAPTFFFPCGSDTYPIYVDVTDPELKVKNFFQTAEFRRWIEKSREYVVQGIAPSDPGSNKPENLFYAGLCGAISDYSVVKLSERILNFKSLQLTGELYDVFLESEDNQKWVMRGGDNCMVVLSHSENIEEVMDFFAWTKNQANHDLVTLGVLGTNYYLTADGKITFTDPVSGETIRPDKRFCTNAPYWAYNDITYQRWSEEIDDAWIEETVNWEKNDENGKPLNYNVSPLNGFNIYPTNAYKIAFQKVSDRTAMMATLLQGRIPNYDTEVPKMIEDVNANGMQDLIDEVQRQINEFLATKK